jgi:hypothetical protein
MLNEITALQYMTTLYTLILSSDYKSKAEVLNTIFST